MCCLFFVVVVFNHYRGIGSPAVQLWEENLIELHCISVGVFQTYSLSKFENFTFELFFKLMGFSN